MDGAGLFAREPEDVRGGVGWLVGYTEGTGGGRGKGKGKGKGKGRG